MVRRKLMPKVAGTCVLALCALSAAHRSLAAEITWEQAKEMLRSGEGLTGEPTLGAPIENPDAYGAEANPTGNPVGGGPGYSRILTSGDYTVGSREELLGALEQAKAGQVVYVKPDAEIDLTGLVHIAVPDGVTLAGNRGQDGAEGPLLLTTKMGESSYPFLFGTGSKTRVTGLRIKGPDPDYADYTEQTKAAGYEFGARAIATRGETEVDNCEISNFYRDGVAANSKGVHVHHNFIHDIAAYPVVVGTHSGPPTLIEANIIHWGWHATAGSGTAVTGYEARYNICKPHNIAPPFGKVAHCLDQHPDIDILRARKLRVAGDSLQWHHNTLILHGGSTDPTSTVGMKIRGTPRSLARVYANWFQTTDVSQALGLSFSNVWIYNNVYGPEKRGLAEITQRTTPQILLEAPRPPELEPHTVRGKLALDVEVNVLEPLRLAGVIVKLDDIELFLEPRAPRAEEVVIDTAKLSEGDHKLSVSAIDHRGALGTQEVYLDVAR
jgi:hypothetical protein